MMLFPSSSLMYWQTRSKYFLISANPLFFAISSLMGIFISVVDDTLTSISPACSMILVAVSNISPLTFPLTSSRLMSLMQMFQNSSSFLNVYRMYSKSRDDIIRTFLYERQMSFASPPGVSRTLRNSSMFGSNWRCSSKSLEIASQVWQSVGSRQKYLKQFSFPSWKQCIRKGQEVSGSAMQAPAGTSKIEPRSTSFYLKRWQQGWSSGITSVYVLLLSFLSSRRETSLLLISAVLLLISECISASLLLLLTFLSSSRESFILFERAKLLELLKNSFYWRWVR